ncbi:peptidase E [Flavobacteriaceae bacterium XHP0103]|uniref:DUF6702 family protein n=1 Tax=Marixanthotalea marina TaxID=2844359 RepID=UPI002989BE73|nr:DUF6702 family protein [Marixanthotalea marina]MBU3821911.1 peptidase E [Marixanthotalea marina]
MKFIKIFILFFAAITFSFTTVHKYYLSLTQVEYVKDKKAVQIISRIFIDDMEDALKMRYDESLNMDYSNSETLDAYINKYITEKIEVKINGKRQKMNYIGKEADLDIIKVYLEIEDVEAIHSFQITNKVLFDLFAEQQNMVKLKINTSQKSYLLSLQKDNAVLNFD